MESKLIKIKNNNKR